ncbi:hypothetical protein A9Q84_10925 [Halobacteriovorax marinus]|uniref:Response regulatory domain-containing protein n=1 Tax=Halobacteriovorax marinus TaxID=97084 RepID=A0A1Y5FE14_9BACT|nr:hypothetical protein A9Q84_10925 [Halobacteriovorax marinus]
MNIPILDDEFKKLQNEYALELPELIDSIEKFLMKIEEQSEAESSMKDLKRIVHSIKGTAGSYELGWVSSLCHQFEDHIDDTLEEFNEIPQNNVQELLNYIDLFRCYVADFLKQSIDEESYVKNLAKLTNKEVEVGSVEKKKVLIIESASTLLKAYKLLITSLNMSYATAISGREGFERLLIEKYDYLITGHATGIVDGPSLIAISKVFNGESRGVKTILTTSIDELNLVPEQRPDFLVEKKLGMMEKIQDILEGKEELEPDSNVHSVEKILCIDDDESVLKLLKLSFSKIEGVEVACASSIDEGEKLLKSFNPNLVLLDYYLEEHTGVEILQELRQKHNYKKDVIFLTAASKEEELQKIYNSGAIGVILKPFVPKRLYNSILEMMKKTA